MNSIQSIPGRFISWTLFRYIIKDTLFAFFVAFLFFFFVFFANQILLLAREILTRQVPLFQVVLLIFYVLPQVIALAAPFGCLMGTLITIGRLSSDNEILVMLASGLSFKIIFLPALAVGILISILSFFTNDVLLPLGTVQFQRLYRRILVSTPALELDANSVKRYRDTVIITGPVSGTAIENMVILDRTAEGERRVILAQTAELTDSGNEGLSLDLQGAFFVSSREIARNDYDYASSDFLRYWVPEDDIIQAIHSIGPNQMSSLDLRREILVMNQEHNRNMDNRYNRVMTNALQLEDSLRRGPGDQEWNRRDNYYNAFYREKQSSLLTRSNMRLSIYRLEYHKKFSIPFGALSFVFLAVPLGLLAKKSGQTVGFILGLIISALYWSIIWVGQTVGVRLGFSPFWSMWMPNIMASSAGLILLIIRIRK